MGARFPFKTTADEYSWQLWNKQVYLYLAEFFSKAKFANKAPVSSATDPMLDESIDGYRNSGPDDEWELPCGASSATAAYASYFKLYDASTTGACKIGVKDGSAVSPMAENCGIGWVNGEEIAVAVAEHEVSSSGSAWLQAFLNESGVGIRIVLTTGSSPEAGEGDVLYQNRRIGRWTVAQDGESNDYIAATNQDYLQGGECVFILMEPCQ